MHTQALSVVFEFLLFFTVSDHKSLVHWNAFAFTVHGDVTNFQRKCEIELFQRHNAISLEKVLLVNKGWSLAYSVCNSHLVSFLEIICAEQLRVS